MKYAYELTYKGGVKAFSTQNYKFTEQQVLDAFKSDGIIKVSFFKEIPNGYHLCGCGNLAKGTRDELCDECRETYGHTYEHEL